MKKNLLFLLVLIPIVSFSQKSLRDNINVIHYTIRTQFPDLSKPEIVSHTTIALKIKQKSSNQIVFDFSDYEIDGIKLRRSGLIEYEKLPEKIRISSKKEFVKDSTYIFDFFYHGKPAKDQRWGGFYFDKQTAFNMGVGMKSMPQVFGRCWFPCNDTLTDKATYSFEITSDKNLKAVCSGVLDSVKTGNFNNSTYYWSQKLPISTYLASVAVGNYKVIEITYKSDSLKIPIEIYVKNAQKEAVKKSFIHIATAASVFEKYYGSYRWNRIGFVVVPFSSGAMEHAENIAYPEYAVDGSLNNEMLMVHEFSHSWFGNLVTCATPEDMWINEAWASYSEALFVENVYGKEAYRNYVRDNHRNVLSTAHLYDNGFRAVYGNTGDYTYGSTVYDKGADMIHSIRGALGDSVFFISARGFLDKYAFSNASTEDLINHFESIAKQDLSFLFLDKIYSPGFSAYTVSDLSTRRINMGYTNSVTIKQSLFGRKAYAQNIPVEIRFYGENCNSETHTISITGQKTQATVNTNIKPVFCVIDPEEKLSDACVKGLKELQHDSIIEFENTDFKCLTGNIKTRSIMNVRLNFTEPDHIKVGNYHRVSPYFWSLSALSDNFEGTGIFTVIRNFHGIDADTDKIVLLYRKNENESWKNIQFKSSEVNSNTFELTVENLQCGDFCVAEKK